MNEPIRRIDYEQLRSFYPLVLSILYYKKLKNRIFFIINQEILFIKRFSKVSLVYLIL